MRAVIELPRLTGELGYHARFAEAERHRDGSIDCSFDISWRCAERSTPPTDLLMLVRQRYEVKAFVLNTEDGR